VAGAETQIVSPKTERVRGWNFTEWREEFAVDRPLACASAPRISSTGK
jgi:protease I